MEGAIIFNCWKKNGYPPNFKSRFSQANFVTGLEEICEQDIEEQVGYDEFHSDTQNNNLSENNCVASTSQRSIPPTIYSPEQLAQIAQIIQAQTQQSVEIPMNNVNAASTRVEYSHQIDYGKNDDSSNTKSLNKDTWIIDTGASCHISNSMLFFENNKHVDNW